MEERVRFVARLLDGEGMSAVCREFGISRKTGYKIFNRYRQEGLEALCDRSRRPVRYANQLPEQIERLIVESKRDKPHWGARKIREPLIRKLASEVLRDGLRLVEQREAREKARLDALTKAASIGFRDIEEGRFRDIGDNSLEEFISGLGQQASALVKKAGR
jgi:transposase